MWTNTNLTLDRGFRINNFEEDKIAILKKNPGLRFEVQEDGIYNFNGNYYLKDLDDKLIESFEVKVIIPKKYPNSVPVVISTDEKITKIDDYHISKEGIICFDHNYRLNKIASGGLRLYDFIEYYFPKYFSWVLLKKSGKNEKLAEWAHQAEGTLQFYQSILATNNLQIIVQFISEYLLAIKPSRNNKCYCGSGKKLKNCHLDAVNILRGTSKKELRDDFQKIIKLK